MKAQSDQTESWSTQEAQPGANGTFSTSLEVEQAWRQNDWFFYKGSLKE